MYLLVRTDLPLADQCVQAAHAALEAGALFPQPERKPHLALLAVRSEAALLEAVERAAPVRLAVYWEPDDGMGWTAAASEPVIGEGRRAFRRYPLWKP